MVNLGMAIAIPLYIWPTTNAWKPLFSSITANPNATFNVIINPDSGPGDGLSEPEVVSNVAKLNGYHNVNLFGYVHVSYGKRNITQVESDVKTYSGWAAYKSADVHLDGIFLDEAPDDLAELPYMKQVAGYIKATLPAKHDRLIWTNPGIPIDEAFYDHADYVNAYENSYADWKGNGGLGAVPACLRSRSTVMIYSYTAGKAQLLTDTKAVVEAGYNATFVTDASGYEKFGANWAQYTKDVASLVKTKVKTLPTTCDAKC